MDRNVAKYHGVKYSLQTHGLKSRLMVALAFFVVSFGGALSVANSAAADPPLPSASPSSSPLPSPTPSPSPSLLPSPTPVISVVTVTVTKTITKTVVNTVTITLEPLLNEAVGPPLAPLTTSEPSVMSQPTMSPASSGGSSLAGWGVAVAVAAGIVLIVLGGMAIARRRMYQGSHHAEDSGIQLVKNYDHSQDLDTEETPKVGLDDTKPLPKIQ